MAASLVSNDFASSPEQTSEIADTSMDDLVQSPETESLASSPLPMELLAI